MAWKIDFSDSVLKSLRHIDNSQKRRIFSYLKSHVLGSDNPRQFGKALTGYMAGLWRYRVGDYRIVVSIQDDKVLVLVVRIAHSKDVYED